MSNINSTCATVANVILYLLHLCVYFYFLCNVCVCVCFFHKVASLLGWFMYFQSCCIVFLFMFMLWQIKFSLSLWRHIARFLDIQVVYRWLHFHCPWHRRIFLYQFSNFT